MSASNAPLTIAFTLTGESLDALFGRALTAAEREMLEKNISYHLTGQDALPSVIGGAMSAAAEQINYEMYEDDDENVLAVPDDDRVHYHNRDYDGEVVQTIDLRVYDERYVRDGGICGRERPCARIRREEYEKEREEALAVYKKPATRVWTELPLAEVVAKVKSWDLDAYSARTAKWFEDNGITEFVSHLFDYDTIDYPSRSYTPGEFDFVDHTFPDGGTKRIWYIKDKVVINDTALLSSVARAFDIKLTTSKRGRGSGFLEYIEQFITQAEEKIAKGSE